jgi:hypothetical protein
VVHADGLTGVQEQQHQDLSRLASGDADVPLPVCDEQRPKHPEPNAVHGSHDSPLIASHLIHDEQRSTTKVGGTRLPTNGSEISVVRGARITAKQRKVVRKSFGDHPRARIGDTRDQRGKRNSDLR